MGTPTMIEKCARAICDAEARARYPRMMEGSRAAYVEENWNRYAAMHARAVLEALLPVTQEMVYAGEQALNEFSIAPPDGREECEVAFVAMIDAALNEGQTS